MTRAAWYCPACQKHHGPHVDTCPGTATRDPCARCEGACLNAACPKRHIATCEAPADAIGSYDE